MMWRHLKHHARCFYIYSFILTTSFTEEETELLAKGQHSKLVSVGELWFSQVSLHSAACGWGELTSRGASCMWAVFHWGQRKSPVDSFSWNLLANFWLHFPPSRVRRCFSRRLLGLLETKYGSHIVGLFERLYHRGSPLVSFLKGRESFLVT